jgi:hypothetical protein
MCSPGTTHVLALCDFTKTFFLECDTSGKEIGVVLVQDGKHLDFTIKQLSKRHLGQSIYEKEMLDIFSFYGSLASLSIGETLPN